MIVLEKPTESGIMGSWREVVSSYHGTFSNYARGTSRAEAKGQDFRMSFQVSHVELCGLKGKLICLSTTPTQHSIFELGSVYPNRSTLTFFQD